MGDELQSGNAPEGDGFVSIDGYKLFRARYAKSMSFADLAAASGVSKGYLWKLENGEHKRPTARLLGDIAEALGIKPTGLMPDEPNGQAA